MKRLTVTVTDFAEWAADLKGPWGGAVFMTALMPIAALGGAIPFTVHRIVTDSMDLGGAQLWVLYRLRDFAWGYGISFGLGLAALVLSVGIHLVARLRPSQQQRLVVTVIVPPIGYVACQSIRGEYGGAVQAIVLGLVTQAIWSGGAWVRRWLHGA